MHDILKIFIGTAIVILVTSLVFFALYFIAPQISEDVFGISYRSEGENPIATAPRSLDDVTGGRSGAEVLSAVASDSASYVSENSEEIMASFLESTEGLSETGKALYDQLALSASDAAYSAKEMLSDVDPEVAKDALNRVGDYISRTGQSVAEMSADEIDNLLSLAGVN